MKEVISNLTTRRSSRSSVANVCTNTQDYFITTMKLRDRVLTARAAVQSNCRKTIRQLRSAPPFQNRNLDNYPMPYNREDAVKSARGHRAEKRDKNSKMVKERAASGLMREYSKQMFDFSVKNVNNSIGYRCRYENNNRVPSRAKSESEHSVVAKTNGPTPDGSILHNRRQKMLNSIRIRPHVEYENKFHHERTYSRLSLEHTISDKNRHYRVRSVTESSRPMSVVGDASVASSDFIFEPVDQSSEMNGFCVQNAACQRRSTLETPLSTYEETDSIDGVFGKDPFDDIDGGTSLPGWEVKRINHVVRPSVSTLLPPDVSCNLRLVSLDEESSSESEEEKEEPIPEVKKSEPQPPSKPTARGKKNKITFKEEEKSKIPEPEPEPEPVKVKLILKGPHCWVDDATVTSEQSEDENEDNPDGTNTAAVQDPQSNGKTERLNNTQNVDNTNKLKTVMKNSVNAAAKTQINTTALRQSNQQAMKNAFENALQNVQLEQNGVANVVINHAESFAQTQVDEKEGAKTTLEENDDDKKGHEIKLPPFICPSSEKKSRQAALKDWLAHTCFESGHRVVPIV